MSGLNDDVEDGLDFSPEVEVENPNQPQGKEITFITNQEQDNNNVNANDLFGTDIVKNELPNIKAEYLIITEQLEKLKDIKSIFLNIKNSNGICKEDVVELDSVIPGFINDERPIGFFTEDKSRTQFNETLNTINKAVDTQVAELAIKASEAAEKAFKSLSSFIKDIEPKIISKLTLLSEKVNNLPELLNKEEIDSPLNKFFSEFISKDLMSFELKEIDNTETNQKFNKILEIQKAFSTSRRNICNLNILLNYVIDNNREGRIYHMLSYGRYSEILLNDKDYPITASITNEEVLDTFYKSNFSYYHLFVGCCDSLAKDYLMSLVKCVVILIEIINNNKTQIDSITKSENDNQQDKLNKLYEIYSSLTRNSINSMIILSFIKDYCVYVENLSKALEETIKL